MGLLSRLFASRQRTTAPTVYRSAVPIAAPAETEADRWVRILAEGEFLNHPDGAHAVTRTHLEQMVEQFASTSTDLLIDRDHGSLWYGDTKAAGWSDAIELRDDGLYMRYPTFTSSAQVEIDEREYRYFSPAYQLVTAGEDGLARGAQLYSVAITSFPYLNRGQIDAIGNSAGRRAPDPDPTQTPDAVDRDKLIQLYDLDADATDEQIQAAVNAAIAAKAETPPADPGPDADDEGEDDVAKLSSRIERMERERDDAKVDALVASSIARGALLPADAKAFKSHARADFADAKRQLDARKDNSAIPGTVRTTEPDDKPRTSAGRHADAVAHLKGLRKTA